MRINKINPEKMIITLTEEELYFDYDLELEDLVNADVRPKVSKTLINIITNVAKEYNIQITNGMSISIRMNSNNEIEIEVLFQKSSNENNLYGIAKFLKSIIKTLPSSNVSNFIDNVCFKMNLSEEETNKIHQIINSEECELDEKENDEPVNYDYLNYIFIANTLNDIIKVAPLIINYISESTIYKLNDKYYLELNILENSDYIILNVMSEFMLTRNDNIRTEYLKEHGNIIIEKDAIKKLCSI